MRPQRQLRFEAIGTRWTISLYQPIDNAAFAALEATIHQRIETFDQHYSRFRPDSLVSTMARQAGTYQLPADAKPMFDLYAKLYDLTDGAVTPLIGQTLSDAGYDAQYTLQPGALHQPPAWDDVIHYQYPELTLSRPALLDLGAAGKGYLVDLVGEVLATHQITHYLVDAGGDMRHRHPSGQSLDIGLEHPSQPEHVIGVAWLANQSLCGSAGNRRAWGNYHHILDPHTLASPRHIQAIWVTAATTMLADALTTALFFVPATRLAKHYQFEYAIVHHDGTLEASAHFPATFFTANEEHHEPTRPDR